MTVDETVATDDAVFTVPPDHPLRRQFANFRAAEVSGDTDWLWVRLLDVPRALTGRGRLTDGELVLDIDDPFLNEHSRYLLTIRDGKADCVPTDRQPVLSLDIRHAGPATRADTLFRTERSPHCLNWF